MFSCDRACLRPRTTLNRDCADWGACLARLRMERVVIRRSGERRTVPGAWSEMPRPFRLAGRETCRVLAGVTRTAEYGPSGGLNERGSEVAAEAAAESLEGWAGLQRAPVSWSRTQRSCAGGARPGGLTRVLGVDAGDVGASPAVARRPRLV